MTSRDFCYWLQGFLELRGPGEATKEQVECIQKHLAMVFKHEIDPSYADSDALNEIHNKPKPPTGGAGGPSGHGHGGMGPLYRC